MSKIIPYKNAQDCWDRNPDKESYYWKTSGKYTYQCMLRIEYQEGKKVCDINKDNMDVLSRAKELKKRYGKNSTPLRRLLNDQDHITKDYIEKELKLK